MPKLLKSTELMKIDQAVQVNLMMESDAKLTKAEACEKVGISLYQYNTWIAEADEVLEMFRKAQVGLHRIELQRNLNAQEHILERLIHDGISPLTDPEARLKIYQFITDRTEHLMDLVHAGTEADTDFLQGPSLTKVESRFSPSEVTITIKQKPTTVIDVTPEREPTP
jgi:ACT domain-containing protein